MVKQALKSDATLQKERDAKIRPESKRPSKSTKSAKAVVPSAKQEELHLLKVRDQLIEQYMPYAASIASRVCQTLSSTVDYEEVLCNARLGLLEAAKRFDPKHDVDFRTFAYYRIKGAIYDGLRRSGWLPRTLYAKIKFEEAANEYLQHQSLYRAENGGETRKSTTLSGEGGETDHVTETVSSLASIYIVSIDATEDMEIEDQNGTDIEKRTEFMQIRKHMREAIGSLPEKEKQLVMMYYFQNRTLEEIGERLGLSKSWTSRLHARALTLLFKRIKNRAQPKKDDNEDGGEEE
ncbi:MAG: hypothetical protein A3I05_03380 [Deltaproteobacteria bacterium RIFCSPLOWO2_02_FULL_44_10]|nr:MAG: hypothetical protein A3C46_02955 [Deltaproteobacteria bacterium RIFCSPHIGHO2_02_FULL_44_16]OGQ46215.1 MAG: hypothetical protein A3I05_03380 [Deltaproteobacteria bacterium RIFCSPLOWO2_02_FULL_44_10]